MSSCPALEALVGDGFATVTEVLDARARLSGHRTLVISGDQRWSYAQAVDISRRAGGFFQRLVAGAAGQRVAVYLSKRPEGLWAWFGAAYASAVHVAVHRAHRGEILVDQLRRARATILVTERQALADLPDLASIGYRNLVLVDGYTTLERIEVHAWDSVIAGDPASPAVVSPFDVASLVFTSGSTGRSRATLIPHNQLCRGGARVAEAFGLQETDVCHDWAPLSHIGGQLDVTMSAIVAGAALALFPTFSASRFWEQVRKAGSTYFTGFSNVVHILLSQPVAESDSENTLRLALVAGTPPVLLRRFEQRFGLSTVDAYGMTEAEPLVLRSPDDAAAGHSLGRPNPDFEVAVVDDHDQPLPAGTVGRIVARPRVPGVMMLGYEDDAEATVEACRNLWLHTRDLGSIDALGCVHFSDREHNVIRRRGENISSFELESILRVHPAVLDCAVVGVRSPLGEQDVKAVVVLHDGVPATESELHDFMAARAARFMVPRFVEVRASLPFTALGKLDRLALAEHRSREWDAEAAQAPNSDGDADARIHRAAR